MAGAGVKRRKLDFHDFAEVRREIERLCDCGYERVGQWGLAQMCDHLAIALEGSINGFEMHAPWLMRKLYRFVGLRFILIRRRIPERVKSPALKYLSSPDVDLDKARQRLTNAMAAVDAHSGEFAPHPFFERIAPEQWRQLHLIHCAHHLSFLLPRDAKR